MKKLLFIALAFALVCAGCLHNNVKPVKTKSVTEMTTLERSTWMLSTYNSVYADYMTVTGHSKSSGVWEKVHNPVLSENKRTVLGSKKKILTRVYPLIKIYVGVVDSGGVPDRDTEREIIGLLNQLTGV